MDATDEPTGPAAEARLASRARDTELVLAIRAGDGEAFGQLYDAWFDRIYDLTHRIVRNPDIAAELTQDTFLKAWRSLGSLENPEAFGGWLLRIARNAAYNRSAREGRSSAFDDQGLAMIESVGASPSSAPAGFNVEDRLGRASSPEAALEDREAQSLVWQAAAALPARDIEVLDLQLRHGLSPAEIGDVIGMNRNAANQLVHRLRGRLEAAIRARVLWRDGQPSCAVLATRLQEAGIATFGADAVKVIERHVPGCDDCDAKQRLRLQPAALFAAAPLLIAPQLIKSQAASALEAAGVPMQGSAFSSFATSGLSAAGSPGGSGAGPGAGSGGSGAAGGAGGMPVGVPAAVATVSELGAKTTTHTVRNSLLAVAAVVVVIGGVFALSSRRSDEKPAVEVAASNVPGTSAVPSTTARSGSNIHVSSTTSTRSGPTSTAGGVSPSSAPVAPTSQSTNGSPTTATTPRPATTTTTAPNTTTTALPVDATVTMTPPTRDNQPWPMTQSRQVSPTLSWSVVTKGKVTVAVEGPAPDNPKQLLSSELTGSVIVCPGTIVNLSAVQACSAAAGTYTYTLTVTGPDSKVITTKTATLTLTQYVG